MKNNFFLVIISLIVWTSLIYTVDSAVEVTNNPESLEKASQITPISTPRKKPVLPPTPLRSAKKAIPFDVCCIPPSTPQDIANLTKSDLQIHGNDNTNWFDIAVFINFRNISPNVPKLDRVDLTKSNIQKKGLTIMLDVLRKSCGRTRQSPTLTFIFTTTQYEQLFNVDYILEEISLKANLLFLKVGEGG